MSLLALLSKLQGGGCLTHVGREGRAEIVVVGDHLEIRTKEGDLVLFPLSANEWFVEGMAATVTFQRDASGAPVQMLITYEGATRRVRRVL